MSTHFFRGDGLVRSLAELGMLDDVLATGAPPLVGQIFYWGGMPHGELNPPQDPGDVGFGLSVRRRPLDAIIAHHVSRMPNVTFITNARVTDLIFGVDRVTGVVTDDGSTYVADLVVGADGRRSMVARRARALESERLEPTRVMYFQYVTGWRAPDGGPPNMPEFSAYDDELAYVFPSDAGVACIALSINVRLWTDSRSQRARFYADRLRHHHGLAPRLERTSTVSELFAASPTFSVVRQAAGDGWALVGDAGCYQDPWTGLGMDTAARHAVALAEALDGHARWQERYGEARDAATLERFAFTAGVGRDLRQLRSSPIDESP
jgi:2-polyprenyl-6-methoxyphenol hydroxylase-like FAD-dependent oxidoreductase